jgi:hypothetical protein
MMGAIALECLLMCAIAQSQFRKVVILAFDYFPIEDVLQIVTRAASASKGKFFCLLNTPPSA